MKSDVRGNIECVCVCTYVQGKRGTIYIGRGEIVEMKRKKREKSLDIKQVDQSSRKPKSKESQRD